MSETGEISKSWRIRLWLAAWVIVLVITPIPGCIGHADLFPYFVMSIWTFPYGLVAYAFSAHNFPSRGVIYGAVAFGWVFYAMLTWIGLTRRRPAGFFVIYAILWAFLILNGVGCYANMMKGAKLE